MELRSRIRLRAGPRVNERRLALLFGTAASLHTIVDPIVTYYVSIVATKGYELNPFVRWALAQGWPTFLGVHIPLVLLSVLGFYALLHFIRQADPPTDTRLAKALELGSGAIIVWGLGLVGWNLAVLVGLF